MWGMPESRKHDRRASVARRFLTMLAVLLIACVPTVTAAGAAVATVGDLQCDGVESQTYDPPLTLQLTHHHVSATATLRCESLTVPQIQSAQATLSGTGTLNCLTGSTTGTITFRYNDGIGSSVVDYNGGITVRPDGQTISTITGTVVGGLFKDDTMSWTTVMATTDITKCLTTGTETVAGAATVTFL